MSTSKTRNTLFVMAALIGASATLHGIPVNGRVNLSGSAAITALAVDFYGNPALGCSQQGVGTVGCFLSNVPLTGDFATLVPGQVGGTIKDLQGPPISGNISLAAFLSFVNGIVFDLTRVVPGGGSDCATVNPNAPNVSCTPVIGGMISPFILTNSATGTNASIFFNVEVNGYLGSIGSGFTRYMGAFNAPSAGKNIAQIMADLGNGIPVTAAYSANFSPAPPNPFGTGPLGEANCKGKVASALAQQYGGLSNAAAALGYASVADLQNAIGSFCGS